MQDGKQQTAKRKIEMTTNEIIKATNTAVALADDADPFQAFADAVAPQYIVGKLLKFSKGIWLAGEASEPVEHKQFIVGMHAMMTGWVRWRDFKPVEHAMICVGNRLLPPRRHELGDNDRETWEIDDRGQRKDPWQLTSYLPMITADNGEVFTFTASSKGALGTLGRLSRTYAAHRRPLPAELPVVSLSSDGYQHPNRAYGWISTPLLAVTGWAEVSHFNETMALAGYEMPDNGEPAALEAAAEAKPNADMDDDIPF
jgi:hypothetical protein